MSEDTTNETEVQQEPTAAEIMSTKETSFFDKLPEDLRAEPSLADIKDEVSLAKGYVNAQRMIGNSVRIPTEDASEEAKADFYKKLSSVPGVVTLPKEGDEESLNSFYNRLGRPEAADKYNFELPEGVTPDQSRIEAFSKVAFDAGLTKEQAAKLVSFEAQSQMQLNQAQQATLESTQSALKEKWGGDYDSRLQGANEVLAHYSQTNPEAAQQIIATAGNNGVLIEMLSDLAPSLKETGHIGSSEGSNYGITPADAAEQISDIRSNKAHPYHNEFDPGHKEAMAKMEKLYRVVYPD